MMQDNENLNKEALIENDGFLSDSILALDDRNIEIGGSCKLPSSQNPNEDKQSAIENVQFISLQMYTCEYNLFPPAYLHK
jgi:hypothetical protein